MLALKINLPFITNAGYIDHNNVRSKACYTANYQMKHETKAVWAEKLGHFPQNILTRAQAFTDS